MPVAAYVDRKSDQLSQNTPKQIDCAVSASFAFAFELAIAC
jgi:hypothetical protein